MKSLFSVILLLAILMSLFGLKYVFAQDSDSPEDTIVGIVQSIIMDNSAESSKKGVLTVVGDDFDLISFVVTSNTEFYDADYASISVDKIIAGAKIDVEYFKLEDGTLEAVAVSIVE